MSLSAVETTISSLISSVSSDTSLCRIADRISNLLTGHILTSRLVECVIDADSFSDLEKALSVPNCSLYVSDSLDAFAPLLSILIGLVFSLVY